MGENLSVQHKIESWLKAHPNFAGKTNDEIISAMLSEADNNLSLSELQELSLFADSINSSNINNVSFDNSIAITKEQEGLIKQALLDRVSSLNIDNAENNNSWLGKAWNWTKNTFNIGDSSNDARNLKDKEINAVNSLSVKDAFVSLTGVEFSQDNIQKFLEGEIKTKAEIALDAYIEGQDMVSDFTGDIISGIAAVGIYTAAVALAPFSGGASIAIGAASATALGGVIKAGVKSLDTLGTDKKYNSFSKDLATGAFSGLLAPVTAGLGGAIGKITAKALGVQAVKTLGKEGIESASETTLKTLAKNALLNPAGYEYKGGTLIARMSAQGTEMATDGALGGGIDSAFRAGIKGEDISDAFISGLAGGAILSPIIGGGFKAAGKVGNKVSFPIKPLNLSDIKKLFPDGKIEQNNHFINAIKNLLNQVNTSRPVINLAPNLTNKEIS